MYSPLLLHIPAFIPAMGATGQHGWGGRPHHLFCLPCFRAGKQVLPHRGTQWYMGDCVCLPATFLAHPYLCGKLRQ